MPSHSIAPHVQAFFAEYLCQQKRLSPHTIVSCRDTFRLWLTFLRDQTGIEPSALRITELKAAYREMFAKQIGYNLGIKLIFAFVLVILSVYQALGVGHRFVKRHEGGDQVTPEELGSVIRRLKSANWGILLLAVITLWLGIRLRS